MLERIGINLGDVLVKDNNLYGALISLNLCWMSMLQRTASTELENSASTLSPKVLKTRPLW